MLCKQCITTCTQLPGHKGWHFIHFDDMKAVSLAMLALMSVKFINVKPFFIDNVYHGPWQTHIHNVDGIGYISSTTH